MRASELYTKNSCLTRRSHSLIPMLRQESTMPMERSIISKAILKVALLSRVLKKIPNLDLQELWDKYIVMEETVKPHEKYLAHILSLAVKCYRSIFHEFPDWEDMEDVIRRAETRPFIANALSVAFEGLNLPTVKTARLVAEHMEGLICRYLIWETRTPVFPEPMDIDLFGQQVTVAPDLLFTDGFGSLEVDMIRFRKPDITQNGKKRDTSAANNLELYALWRYGDAVAKQFCATDVVASILFMRRSDDQQGYLQPIFYDRSSRANSKNIVSLAYEAGTSLNDDFHLHFKQLMEEFLDGTHECTESDCEKCDFRRLCTYTKPPLSVKEPKRTKKIDVSMLTPEQEQAVFFRNGVARINAGAGAGKTLVMSMFVGTLLDEGVDPSKILCVTFTNAGAQELKERIIACNEDFQNGDDIDASQVICTTFNGFGNTIICDRYEDLDFSDEPRLIDPIERADVIAGLLQHEDIPGLDYERFDCDFPNCKGALPVVRAAFEEIKARPDNFPTAKELKEIMSEQYGRYISSDDAYQRMIDLFFKYDATLRRKNLIEYADQENLLLELMALDPYMWEEFGFEYVVIDEFQDSSPLQMRLVSEIINCPSFKALIVAGDDSQAIFSFRGTTPENIIEFFDKLNIPASDRHDISIVENHRSTPQIIDFANQINDINIYRVIKSLIATRPDGAPVTVKGFHRSEDEYSYICEEVKKKLASGATPEDIAIFAATRNELLQIASYLTDAGIETVLLSPEPMLENSNVQAGIALTHFLSDPMETESIAVYLNALSGGTLLQLPDDEVNRLIEEKMNFVIDKFRSAGSAERKKIFSEMMNAIDPDEEDSVFCNFKERLTYRRRLKDKLDYVKMFERYGGEDIKRDGKYPGVVLSTVHSSKGLEWPYVFVSLSKFDRKSHRASDIEERRRLFFVAATRARDELCITGLYEAYKRRSTGSDGKQYSVPVLNRYLKEAYEILGESYDPVDHDKAAREARKRAKNAIKRKNN